MERCCPGLRLPLLATYFADCFDQFLALLRQREREADEDKVMDMMDCIVGCVVRKLDCSGFIGI
jgi:hypothetical protein